MPLLLTLYFIDMICWHAKRAVYYARKDAERVERVCGADMRAALLCLHVITIHHATTASLTPHALQFASVDAAMERARRYARDESACARATR